LTHTQPPYLFQVIVARDLVAPGGTLLIDDVLNQTPVKLGDRSALGKSKYALPYLLAHGFTLEVVGYQYVLQRQQNWDAPVTAASPPYLPAAPLAPLDRPLQAVHVTFHTACVRELDYIARTLRVALTHHVVTDPTLPAADGNLVYNVHHARAERLWATHRRYYARFDLVIVSDTAALARVFLQQGVWTRKLIVWVRGCSLSRVWIPPLLNPTSLLHPGVQPVRLPPRVLLAAGPARGRRLPVPGRRVLQPLPRRGRPPTRRRARRVGGLHGV
jgi:hypothetical protein